LPALKAVGLGLCPADAHRSLLDLGVKVMPRGGGSGAVEEAVALILAEYRHGA
jgi:3-deoxy-D-manno-octulosonate 8-phosphate phosphatase KdsC-like HAD superfamily phosphatase